MKKLLLFYVAVVFTVVTSFAQQTFTSGGLNFQISNAINREAIVTGRATENTATNITIPATAIFNDTTYTVTSIGRAAFALNALESVDISEGVTSIGDFAFNTSILQSVVIPEGVTSIGIGAFQENRLQSVVIPASVTSIGRAAFADNPLTSITSLSTNPATIDNNNNDPFLSFIDGASTRLSITLTIPFGTIGTYNQRGWTGFSSVEEGISFTDQDFTFTDLSATEVAVTGRAEGNTATDITIPATATFNGTTYDVTSIGDRAFEFNDLESVDIPASVTSIGDFAFSNNALESVDIPASVTSIGSEAFSFNNLDSVVIPASVTSIGVFAFADNGLESVDISEGVTSVGDEAFSFNNLTSVNIPASVTSIGDFAFADNALESVDIPEGVTSISASAFLNNDLRSVVIPASVTSIGEGAFQNNTSLTSITSLSINPVDIRFDDPFDGLTRENITLTIPAGTGNAYNESGWTGFNIVEDAILSISDTAVSLKDNFVVLTNPNSISVKSMGIATINVQELVIYAMSGKKVATSTGANISTESLVNGVYLLRIITDKGAVTKKIIK